jgi:hypothetical protein
MLSSMPEEVASLLPAAEAGRLELGLGELLDRGPGRSLDRRLGGGRRLRLGRRGGLGFGRASGFFAASGQRHERSEDEGPRSHGRQPNLRWTDLTIHDVRVSRIFAIGLFALAASVAAAATAQGANTKPDCVDVRAVPVLGAYGTNHVVVVENRCDVTVHCDVATNVDPAPRYPLAVAPGAEASVATRAESPSSSFRPLYTCEAR